MKKPGDVCFVDGVFAMELGGPGSVGVVVVEALFMVLKLLRSLVFMTGISIMFF